MLRSPQTEWLWYGREMSPELQCMSHTGMAPSHDALQCLEVWWDWEKSWFSETGLLWNSAFFQCTPACGMCSQGIAASLRVSWWDSLWKTEARSPARNDTLPWFLHGEGSLFLESYIVNKLLGGWEVQQMRISDSYWKIQFWHHLLFILLIRFACRFSFSEWELLEQKDLFFFSLAFVSSSCFLFAQ